MAAMLGSVNFDPSVFLVFTRNSRYCYSAS